MLKEKECSKNDVIEIVKLVEINMKELLKKVEEMNVEMKDFFLSRW